MAERKEQEVTSSVTSTLRLKPEVRCVIPFLSNKVAQGHKVTNAN